MLKWREGGISIEITHMPGEFHQLVFAAALQEHYYHNFKALACGPLRLSSPSGFPS